MTDSQRHVTPICHTYDTPGTYTVGIESKNVIYLDLGEQNLVDLPSINLNTYTSLIYLSVPDNLFGIDQYNVFLTNPVNVGRAPMTINV